MFGALNKKLLAVAKGAVMERACPNCGVKFKPFADREINSWSDFNQPCNCPKCGRAKQDPFVAERGNPIAP